MVDGRCTVASFPVIGATSRVDLNMWELFNRQQHGETFVSAAHLRRIAEETLL